MEQSMKDHMDCDEVAQICATVRPFTFRNPVTGSTQEVVTPRSLARILAQAVITSRRTYYEASLITAQIVVGLDDHGNDQEYISDCEQAVCDAEPRDAHKTLGLILSLETCCCHAPDWVQTDAYWLLQCVKHQAISRVLDSGAKK
jgi:hypothetical protein|tara:strand:+ start:585 stop:1019 length:435 start_codon:yes stop_codon:yes gene_type:complete